LRAFVTATRQRRSDAAPLSDAEVVRLFQALQRCGLIASADAHVMADALLLSAYGSPRAFQLLIADPNADAALPGPTRCSAGDAHNPSRHHSVRSADEQVTVHDVFSAVVWGGVYEDFSLWRAFSDARLPFGARAVAEEWAYELNGPCGCVGDQRISEGPLHRALRISEGPLHRAIAFDSNDEAGEWLAARLPPKRLNERVVSGATPLIAALRAGRPLPRTVATLLSRVPDVDLTLRAKWYDEKEYTAAEWMAHHRPQWLSPHSAAELKLKTQQFGAQYLPSAAVLCAEALCGGVSVPRELVRLVLQYTALPQPNPWPNAHAVTHAVAAAAASALCCAAHRQAEAASASGRKRRRQTAAAVAAAAAAAPRTKRNRTT
jgi:hypothetical protein